MSPGSSWLVVLEEVVKSTWSCGSGTVHTAGAIKHLFVRLAELISHNSLARGLGVPFLQLSDQPSPLRVMTVS